MAGERKAKIDLHVEIPLLHRKVDNLKLMLIIYKVLLVSFAVLMIYLEGGN